MAFGDFTVVRSTPKRVTNSSGVLAQVAINTPAFEFNTDGTYRGLLVEPAATNLLLRSEEFNEASWVKSNTTVTPNAIIAPDGNLTADKLEATGNNTTRQDVTTTSTSHTASVYVKKGTGADKQNSFGFRNETTSQNLLLFSINYDTLAITYSTGSVGVSAIDSGNGWIRLSFTVSSGITVGNTLRVYIGNYGLSATSGDFIYAWGAQLETRFVATSYIPTVASTANRTADIVSLTGASSLIGQSAGTVFVEVDWREGAGLNQFLIEVSDNSINNRIIIVKNNTASQLRMNIVANDVDQTEQGESIAGYAGIQKIALTYAQDDAALYRNGLSISTDTSIDLTSLGTVSKINIGSRFNSTSIANMWIRSVALFPTRLTNSQLESLTTL